MRPWLSAWPGASITETELVVDRATVDLVPETRRQIEVVEAAIPAGVEPELLRSTLLVFSDLVSRSYAMSHGDWPQPPGDETVPLVETNALRCLGNGSEAAARYPSDLAALRAVADLAEITYLDDPLVDPLSGSLMLMGVVVGVGGVAICRLGLG